MDAGFLFSMIGFYSSVHLVCVPCCSEPFSEVSEFAEVTALLQAKWHLQ